MPITSCRSRKAVERATSPTSGRYASIATVKPHAHCESASAVGLHRSSHGKQICKNRGVPRYVAFLRAINVGGHTVTMEKLREVFIQLGFASVETFIASGNVIFDSRRKPDRKLELEIEKGLETALGYSVATFVRSTQEVQAISDYRPFSGRSLEDENAFYIGFLSDPLKPDAVAALMALKTPIDVFHVNGREIYWHCKGKQSESTFSNRTFERAVKASATFRNVTTIRKLAAKYSKQ
jgi:uncharacterized protein (DUF1697 family)